MKICRICSKIKSLNDFYKNHKSKDGLRSECKECRIKNAQIWYRANSEKAQDNSAAWRESNSERVRRMTKAYRDANPDMIRGQHLKQYWPNLSAQEAFNKFNELKIQQNHCCAICGTNKPNGRTNEFVVDHCHNTGKVRGLLCHPCNSGIGMFKDEVDILNKAILYLTK